MFGSGDGANGAILQMAPLVLIFIVFYFLLIRPQNLKAKELKKQLDALRRGDRVVTAGGIIGTIAKVVNDEEVLVDIAEGTRVRVVRGTITTILARTEPVAGKDTGDSGDESEKADAGDAGDKRKAGARRAAGK